MRIPQQVRVTRTLGNRTSQVEAPIAIATPAAPLGQVYVQLVSRLGKMANKISLNYYIHLPIDLASVKYL